MAVLRVIVLLVKVMGVILFFMLARWSWPRFRYDQLMDIGWKVMIPWGLVNLVVVAVWMEYGDHLARLLGLSPERGMAVVGWGALVLDLAGDHGGRSDRRAATGRDGEQCRPRRERRIVHDHETRRPRTSPG